MRSASSWRYCLALKTPPQPTQTAACRAHERELTHKSKERTMIMEKYAASRPWRFTLPCSNAWRIAEISDRWRCPS